MKNIPYSNAIGSIMFLMVCTRPDIAYSISCLSRYMSNAGLPHWEALKWLLRYLNGSANRGLIFSKCAKGVDLTGYVDSNYANDRDSRRSTTSYIFTLCGSCITWKSELQQIVALSTTEAEYIAATEAFKEALWLEGIVKEIGFLKQKITIFSFQSAIQLCKNPVFHDRTKHIDVRNPLKNGDDDKTLTQSLDRFPETVLVQGGSCADFFSFPLSPTDVSFTPWPFGFFTIGWFQWFPPFPLFLSLHSAAYKSPRVFRRRVVRTDDNSFLSSLYLSGFSPVVLYLCGLWGLSDRVVVVQPVVVLVELLVAVRSYFSPRVKAP
ncbi:UNVERIFIED_CONTAM: Retrovirus-related Pol polyprotein from transposon TNT 1-94 [Sesamum angustifolium]|uniref:Retrovirus-related Pol polyprotein from transposon TNT 1-94 n=1 Tax=Sesamum angustifolium TaxID=2727405 RepID=A0AAW2MJ14_9LAMI